MGSAISKSSIKPSYYPVFLSVSRKPCIVVGGGKVAERKVKMLLQFQASITVISPEITSRLLRFAEKNRIQLLQRPYREGDLKNALLVFAATNDKTINRKIKRDAEKIGVPVNVADNPEMCDFIVPSIIKKGPILIAISTSATLPLLSKKLRKEISTIINNTYITYAQKVGRFRKILIETVHDEVTRKRIMKKIDRTNMHDITTKTIKELKNIFLPCKK